MKKSENENKSNPELDPAIKAMMEHFSPPKNQGTGYFVFDWRTLILFTPFLLYFLNLLEKPFVWWFLLFYSAAILFFHLLLVGRLKEAMAHTLNPFSFVQLVMVNFFLIVVYFGMAFAFLEKIDSSQFKVEISGSIFLNMIYFSMVTIATVGYGDITPTSWISKLGVIFEICVGIWFLIMIIPIAVADQVERIRHFRETKSKMMEELKRGIEEGRLKHVPNPVKEETEKNTK
jgi:hypothetical protein